MPTLKRRINISLPSDTESTLIRLAKRDQVPMATKAADLIRIALQVDEDDVWNEIASQRDKKGSRLISHKFAWR